MCPIVSACVSSGLQVIRSDEQPYPCRQGVGSSWQATMSSYFMGSMDQRVWWRLINPTTLWVEQINIHGTTVVPEEYPLIGTWEIYGSNLRCLIFKTNSRTVMMPILFLLALLEVVMTHYICHQWQQSWYHDHYFVVFMTIILSFSKAF